MSPRAIKLLVVDDNDFIAESLRRRLRTDPSFEWSGWLPSAAELPAIVTERRPDIVLLDVEIPGEDAFEALRRIVNFAPSSRAIMFSGHIRKALIDRAIADGAWGYLSKNDPVETILELVRHVATGGFALSPEAQAEHRRPDPAAALSVRLIHPPPPIPGLPLPSPLPTSATPAPAPPTADR